MTRWLLAVTVVGCGSSSSPSSPDAADITPDAHVNTASIDDTVTDTTGAPVAGATVCLTGIGAPQFGNLAPGNYEITVASTGRTCSILSGGHPINDEWPPTNGGTLSIAVSAKAMTQGLVVNCL
jgi:hypothetical protein